MIAGFRVASAMVPETSRPSSASRVSDACDSMLLACFVPRGSGSIDCAREDASIVPKLHTGTLTVGKSGHFHIGGDQMQSSFGTHLAENMQVTSDGGVGVKA